MPSAAPIASAAHSFVARGFTATPTITQTEEERADGLHDHAGENLAVEPADTTVAP